MPVAFPVCSLDNLVADEGRLLSSYSPPDDVEWRMALRLVGRWGNDPHSLA